MTKMVENLRFFDQILVFLDVLYVTLLLGFVLVHFPQVFQEIEEKIPISKFFLDLDHCARPSRK